MSTLIPCTVQIVTRNNAAGLQKCLDSLTEFSEVIVQDGYSTDGTREIAAKYPNVKLMDQDRRYLNEEGRIVDFASIRNLSIAAAKYDWVFVVDGDEHVHADMIAEVRSIVAKNQPGIWQAFRRFFVDGQPIMHSALYPAIQIRLFHRSQTTGYGKAVHERLSLKPGVVPKMLQAELPVPLPAPSALTAKNERYLFMEVKRAGVLSWGRWFRWVFLWKLRTIAGLLLRLCRIWLVPRKGKRLPLAYEFQYIGHAFATLYSMCPPMARRYLAKEATASHT